MSDWLANKRADALPGVVELIRDRWSPRAFSDRPVSDADLRIVLDAAHWAASSGNEQPWRFVVARKSDGAAFERILNLLVPGNQAWAKHAPVLMVTVAKRAFSHNGAANFHALHDTGAALAYLALQATALGMQAHGMAGFDHERARQDLVIPDEYEAAAAVAMGYLGSPDTLSDALRDRELAKRQRKPLHELVFEGRWDKPIQP